MIIVCSPARFGNQMPTNRLPEVHAAVSSGTLAFTYLFPFPKGQDWTCTS